MQPVVREHHDVAPAISAPARGPCSESMYESNLCKGPVVAAPATLESLTSANPKGSGSGSGLDSGSGSDEGSVAE
jgi:hypothetical protein